MRILVKWYFNELLGYLIISFTPVPVIANDKNKPECIFSSIEMFFFFFVETATKKHKKILFSIHAVLTELYVGNVYNRQQRPKNRFQIQNHCFLR